MWSNISPFCFPIKYIYGIRNSSYCRPCRSWIFYKGNCNFEGRCNLYNMLFRISVYSHCIYFTNLLSQGFALMCTLTQLIKALYTIRVPRYRLLPVDFIYYLILKKCIHECKVFLHCLPHDKPACLVLIGSIYSNN